MPNLALIASLESLTDPLEPKHHTEIAGRREEGTPSSSS